MFFIGMLVGCRGPQPAAQPTAAELPAVANTADNTADNSGANSVAAVAVGYFAGGCFWGVEHFLELLPGVLDVESGYMGGASEAPTYAEVSTGRSGHVEVVRVTYDPAKITYEAVAKRFFEIHDPTEVDRQGPDIGTQYRSAVFVGDDAERAVIDGLIARLRGLGYAVATRVEEAGPFWLAEAYHQDYYARTGKTPYCHAPTPRFDRPAP